MSHLHRAHPEEVADPHFRPATEFSLPFPVSTELAPVPPTTEEPEMWRQGLLSPYGFICVPLAVL